MEIEIPLTLFMGIPAHLAELTLADGSIRLLSVFLLIAINAFFVTAEFSIVSVRRSRIQQLVSTGDVPAQTVQKLHSNLERLLSTTQLGITLSSLALGWIGENTMASILQEAISSAPLSPSIRQTLTHSLSIPLAFILIAYLQIVLGELCPKSVALLYSEELARVLGPPSWAIARFFNPFIWILNHSTRFLLGSVGVRYSTQTWHTRVTPEELQLIISTSTESMGLQASERELLNNVFEFGEVVAEDVMIPRTSIESIAYDATFQDLLDEVAKTGHSRYPVMADSLDDIRGIVNFKQLAGPLAKGDLLPETAIQSWVRPARFVQESTPVLELLRLMQRSHQAMVIVVDEFGGTAGLITIQDIVAEIIGDTEEPDNGQEPLIQQLDEQTYLVQAQLDIEEANDMLNLDLPLDDDYQTLGGFVIAQLQKIPNVGEVLIYGHLEFTVVKAEGPRLDQIRIRRDEQLLNPPDGGDGGMGG
ncbi:hemolysin family protein [Roseofilum sp. BLCC_M154]|uniref:Hemolysin family protein n=1 Tax=Roseofilum acuticapitatum BLCC-M154 TaxID=3022444 RepID=A0ABT7ALT0_9CYAN|nr:hemolysin family protein [Roseofilum acuticapitatum]MDJ1167840.1 hemolysin family protein [Roseofilum acuticapitatum BLCC-M154]